MNILARHEARYIVKSDKRKPRFEIADMDARGWPLVVSCDYVSDPLVNPDHQVGEIGITYKLEYPLN